MIGCTNRPSMVDAALLRPGRLEQHLYVPPPDTAARLAVLRQHVRSLPLSPQMDLATLAEQTERFSCAALGALCREATLCALGRHVWRAQRGGAPSGEGGGEGGEGEGGGDVEGAAENADFGENTVGLNEAMGAMELSDSLLDVARHPTATGSEGSALEVGVRDFEQGMRTVRASLVPSPEAHARMTKEYEHFTAS